MQRLGVLYIILLALELTSITTLTTQQGQILSDPSSIHVAWSRYWGGIDRDYSYDAVFVGGNLYVTGASYSYGPGPVNLVVLKYSQDGELIKNVTYSPTSHLAWSGTASLHPIRSEDPVWSGTYSISSYTMGRGIASDGKSIYVCGIYITDSLAYSLLLKYDLDLQLIWERYWRPDYDAKSTGVALDAANNIYVTGYVELSALRNSEFLLKYNENGDLVFSMVVESETTENAWGISVSDAVYLCGEIGYNTSNPGRPGIPVTGMLLTKISLGGEVIWSRESSIGVDNVGNSVDAKQEIKVAGYTIFGNGTAKIVMARYSPDGDLKNNQVIGESPIEDMAWGLTTAGQYTYIVGHTRPHFGNLADESVYKLKANGELVWQVYSEVTTIERARAVTVSGDDVYVVGESYRRELDMQVSVRKYVSPNTAMNPEMSGILILSPIVIGWLLLLVVGYIIVRAYR